MMELWCKCQSAIMSCRWHALNFQFDCEGTLESVPRTNQFWTMRVKCLAKGNKGNPWWGHNSLIFSLYFDLFWIIKLDQNSKSMMGDRLSDVLQCRSSHWLKWLDKHSEWYWHLENTPYNHIQILAVYIMRLLCVMCITN